MAALTIRKIDDDVKEALKQLAEQDGRSVEGYVRHIIYEVVRLNPVDIPKQNLADKMHEIMKSNKVFLHDDIVEERQEFQRDVLL